MSFRRKDTRSQLSQLEYEHSKSFQSALQGFQADVYRFLATILAGRGQISQGHAFTAEPLVTGFDRVDEARANGGDALF